MTGLTISIFINGQPLEHQPEVPAAGMTGFRGAPGGPFNSRSDNIWTVGETASMRIASTTNSPQPGSGSRMTARIYSDGEAVAMMRAWFILARVRL